MDGEIEQIMMDLADALELAEMVHWYREEEIRIALAVYEAARAIIREEE